MVRPTTTEDDLAIIETDGHIGAHAAWVRCEHRGCPALRSAGYATLRGGRHHGPMVIAANYREVQSGNTYHPAKWEVEVLEGTYY